ncbi:MAG: DUF983 domain-containing protein [Alphaproteobacteria bacterium]|nr:DUF983 domain-containing protein [Alphaproteobacteria bacterium]MBU0794944.1 DUF983 domain-containing protein [Alphaproteobacteria bacterium]MBU0875324.1 DUF983 domain-containing protein [Alphaproteobacteria bacterium]MBU1770826.1 DUF983 domain-containing protein [Alphaproteobacteria bacterium]
MAVSDPVNEQGKQWPRHDPLRTGLRGRCPRCAKGNIFKGFLSIRKDCDSCGLSYDYADPADGPAFFVICFACVPAVIFALVFQVKVDPPLWVHLVTTLPLVLATCILPLRPLKGWLICSQYFFKAREGRVSQPWRPYGADGPLIQPSADPL